MDRTSSIYMTFSVALTFSPPEKMSPPQRQQLCQIILKSMHKCRSYGLDKPGRTNARMHVYLSKIVTAMSRFTTSGLDKNLNIVTELCRPRPDCSCKSSLIRIYTANQISSFGSILGLHVCYQIMVIFTFPNLSFFCC